MESPDHYATLQVVPSADDDVIRAAYRALARKHHPDAGGSSERMTALNQAWHVLSDPFRRALYDRERRLQAAGDRWDGPSSARWDAYRPSPTRRGTDGTVLDFGRYAGWSIADIARTDPDFLEWLARTPSGRPYRSEITEQLARTVLPAPPPLTRPRRRGIFGGR